MIELFVGLEIYYLREGKTGRISEYKPQIAVRKTSEKKQKEERRRRGAKL